MVAELQLTVGGVSGMHDSDFFCPSVVGMKAYAAASTAAAAARAVCKLVLPK
jgi:hypothetical protein